LAGFPEIAVQTARLGALKDRIHDSNLPRMLKLQLLMVVNTS
jgi:hypothetical protein